MRERPHDTMDSSSVLDIEAMCSSTRKAMYAQKVHARCACSGRNRDLRKRSVLGEKEGVPAEEVNVVSSHRMHHRSGVSIAIVEMNTGAELEA